jgi:HTH-type transcriptional regulator/antitoxin HigA
MFPRHRDKPRRRRLAVWPIRTEDDYAEMHTVVDRLIMDAPEHGPLDDRLEVMLSLMESWEARRHRVDISGVTPLDTLRFLLEKHDMTPSDLGRILGDRMLGHKILSGERELSKSHLKRLCEHFKVSADLFL